MVLRSVFITAHRFIYIMKFHHHHHQTRDCCWCCCRVLPFFACYFCLHSIQTIFSNDDLALIRRACRLLVWVLVRSICYYYFCSLLMHSMEFMCAIPHVDWPFLVYYQFTILKCITTLSKSNHIRVNERTSTTLTRACQVQILNYQLRNDSNWMISNTSNVLIIVNIWLMFNLIEICLEIFSKLFLFFPLAPTSFVSC